MGDIRNNIERDHPLAPFGQDKVEMLATFPGLRAADVVLCSPLLSALQTAKAAFHPRKEVIVTPFLREVRAPKNRSDDAVDFVGRTKAELIAEVGENLFDFTDLPEGPWWNEKAESDVEIQGRVEGLIAALSARSENVICLVTHVNFARCMIPLDQRPDKDFLNVRSTRFWPNMPPAVYELSLLEGKLTLKRAVKDVEVLMPPKRGKTILLVRAGYCMGMQMVRDAIRTPEPRPLSKAKKIRMKMARKNIANGVLTKKSTVATILKSVKKLKKNDPKEAKRAAKLAKKEAKREKKARMREAKHNSKRAVKHMTSVCKNDRM